MAKLDVAVVETRWWRQGNTSVRGLFELIATIQKNNPDSYHYEMYNNSASLEEIIGRVSRKRGIRNLYIAAHGWNEGISGAEDLCDNAVEIESLANFLPRRGLDGLYLSSCCTAHADTAELLLKQSNIHWVAGYSGSPDWLEGAALDLYFWARYYDDDNVGTVHERVRRIARNIRRDVRPLCTRFGFNIFLRRQNNTVATLL